MKGNIDFLARDFANWISRSNSGIAASKLGLLCTRDFQVAASSILEDSFIKDVRLLIWTTTLAYTAQGLDSKSSQQQNEALSNLKRFRNSCGDRVVRNLDTLCRPQNIQTFLAATTKAIVSGDSRRIFVGHLHGLLFGTLPMSS